MAKLKITQSSSVSNVTYPKPIGDRYASPTLVGGSHIGGTGGDTGQAGYQIQAASYIKGASQQAAFIVAQKGAHKFRVQDALTNRGDCVLTNAALTSLTAGQMSVQVNLAQATYANLTATTGSATTFAYVTYATANVSAYTPIGATSVLTGTGLTGTVTVQSVSVAAGLANANVSFSSQIVSNIANTGTFNSSVYASRITNKFVYDFGNDGQLDSTNGITTYYTSGYNPNKYKYRLAAPNSTYVQVASA
jgi:hypothetical protein